jgi:preprotein translocase subunit SecG
MASTALRQLAPSLVYTEEESRSISIQTPKKHRARTERRMITILLTIIHVLVCFFLVVVVLLQSGKAADLAGAFGGMGSQTAFGPRGSATVLSKATTIAAAAFMLTSLTLAILATRGATSSGSVLEKQQLPAKSAPAQPGSKSPGTINVTPPGGQPVPVPIPTNAPPPAQQQPAPKK